MQSVTSLTSDAWPRLPVGKVRTCPADKTDRFLVERFRQWIPGWSQQQLSFAGFLDFCDWLGIRVMRCRLLDAYGYAFWIGATPYIYLSNHIGGPELVITSWHEVCHILYHPSHPEVFKRTGNLWNWSKCHRQAEIIGVMAWMPHGVADEMATDELMREFGVRREVAEFRASLNLWR